MPPIEVWVLLLVGLGTSVLNGYWHGRRSSSYEAGDDGYNTK